MTVRLDKVSQEIARSRELPAKMVATDERPESSLWERMSIPQRVFAGALAAGAVLTVGVGAGRLAHNSNPDTKQAKAAVGNSLRNITHGKSIYDANLELMPGTVVRSQPKIVDTSSSAWDAHKANSIDTIGGKGEWVVRPLVLQREGKTWIGFDYEKGKVTAAGELTTEEKAAKMGYVELDDALVTVEPYLPGHKPAIVQTRYITSGNEGQFVDVSGLNDQGYAGALSSAPVS